MKVCEVPETTVCNRHHAISLLLANDPNLLVFIFAGTPQAIRPEAFTDWLAAGQEMDGQTELLIALALEIWWDRSVASIHEAYRYLSRIRFDGLLMAIEFMAAAGGCGCPNCCHRLTDLPPMWDSNLQSF
jgi:hypothetical protein